MEFIFNSKSNKVELYYNSSEEQMAIFNFLMRWASFNTSSNNTVIDNSSDIAWTTKIANNDICINSTPYTITCTTASSNT